MPTIEESHDALDNRDAGARAPAHERAPHEMLGAKPGIEVTCGAAAHARKMRGIEKVGAGLRSGDTKPTAPQRGDHADGKRRFPGAARCRGEDETRDAAGVGRSRIEQSANLHARY